MYTYITYTHSMRQTNRRIASQGSMIQIQQNLWQSSEGNVQWCHKIDSNETYLQTYIDNETIIQELKNLYLDNKEQYILLLSTKDVYLWIWDIYSNNCKLITILNFNKYFLNEPVKILVDWFNKDNNIILCLLATYTGTIYVVLYFMNKDRDKVLYTKHMCTQIVTKPKLWLSIALLKYDKKVVFQANGLSGFFISFLDIHTIIGDQCSSNNISNETPIIEYIPIYITNNITTWNIYVNENKILLLTINILNTINIYEQYCIDNNIEKYKLILQDKINTATKIYQCYWQNYNIFFTISKDFCIRLYTIYNEIFIKSLVSWSPPIIQSSLGSIIEAVPIKFSTVPKIQLRTSQGEYIYWVCNIVSNTKIHIENEGNKYKKDSMWCIIHKDIFLKEVWCNSVTSTHTLNIVNNIDNNNIQQIELESEKKIIDLYTIYINKKCCNGIYAKYTICWLLSYINDTTILYRLWCQKCTFCGLKYNIKECNLVLPKLRFNRIWCGIFLDIEYVLVACTFGWIFFRDETVILSDGIVVLSDNIMVLPDGVDIGAWDRTTKNFLENDTIKNSLGNSNIKYSLENSNIKNPLEDININSLDSTYIQNSENMQYTKGAVRSTAAHENTTHRCIIVGYDTGILKIYINEKGKNELNTIIQKEIGDTIQDIHFIVNEMEFQILYRNRGIIQYKIMNIYSKNISIEIIEYWKQPPKHYKLSYEIFLNKDLLQCRSWDTIGKKNMQAQCIYDWRKRHIYNWWQQEDEIKNTLAQSHRHRNRYIIYDIYIEPNKKKLPQCQFLNKNLLKITIKQKKMYNWGPSFHSKCCQKLINIGKNFILSVSDDGQVQQSCINKFIINNTKIKNITNIKEYSLDNQYNKSICAIKINKNLWNLFFVGEKQHMRWIIWDIKNEKILKLWEDTLDSTTHVKYRLLCIHSILIKDDIYICIGDSGGNLTIYTTVLNNTSIIPPKLYIKSIADFIPCIITDCRQLKLLIDNKYYILCIWCTSRGSMYIDLQYKTKQFRQYNWYTSNGSTINKIDIYNLVYNQKIIISLACDDHSVRILLFDIKMLIKESNEKKYKDINELIEQRLVYEKEYIIHASSVRDVKLQCINYNKYTTVFNIWSIAYDQSIIRNYITLDLNDNVIIKSIQLKKNSGIPDTTSLLILKNKVFVAGRGIEVWECDEDDFRSDCDSTNSSKKING